MSASQTGVLLTSLGSPDHLDEMEEYLVNIRHGRTPSPEFVEEIKGRYRAAGGRSPLRDITERQAEALQNRLDPSRKQFKVYVGMRHWHPSIPSVMKQMVEEGIQKIISLPLTPYDSRLSLQAYHEKVKEAWAELSLMQRPYKECHSEGAKRPKNLSLDPSASLTFGLRMTSTQNLVFAKSWHNHPHLIESFAKLLEQALDRMRQKNTVNPRVLFTAHSLPARILKENDPYPNQLLETASLVAKKAGLSNWNFAYQSQGGLNEPWLGPKVEEMLDFFAMKKATYVLVAPIGFVCDHMEILYDVDILFKRLAGERGMELDRTASLNDSPKFIQALESIVHENVKAFAGVPVPFA